MKTIRIALTIAALSFAACKSDGEKAEPKPDAIEAPATAAQTAAQPESAPAEPAADGGIATIAKGATKVTITEGPGNPTPAFGGEAKVIEDADWLAKFFAAAGDAAPMDAVPKCLPSYSLTFHSGDTEIAKFTAICANASEAVFVKDGQSFKATSDADVVAMLKALGEPAK